MSYYLIINEVLIFENTGGSRMEAEGKQFWQELLNKVLQCEKVSSCLFKNAGIIFCPIGSQEKCEVISFGEKIKDWSLEFFKFYQDRWIEIKKSAPSLPPRFSFQTEELCFLYLTILGMIAVLSSPRINWERRPVFTSCLQNLEEKKPDPREENFAKELFERFKKFTEQADWQDWVQEINVAFEHLEPHDLTRTEIFLVLSAMIEGLENSLSPIKEHSPEDLGRLHYDILQFFKKQNRES